MPGTVLRALNVFTHLFFTTTLWALSITSLILQKIEVQRGEAIAEFALLVRDRAVIQYKWYKWSGF